MSGPSSPQETVPVEVDVPPSEEPTEGEAEVVVPAAA